jgi:hypothetical protein
MLGLRVRKKLQSLLGEYEKWSRRSAGDCRTTISTFR